MKYWRLKKIVIRLELKSHMFAITGNLVTLPSFKRVVKCMLDSLNLLILYVSCIIYPTRFIYKNFLQLQMLWVGRVGERFNFSLKTNIACFCPLISSVDFCSLITSDDLCPLITSDDFVH